MLAPRGAIQGVVLDALGSPVERALVTCDRERSVTTDAAAPLRAPEGEPRVPSGTELREYRLAVAATGEYTIFHGGTVPDGMAAIVTAMNRVNGVYEREVAIRMNLVPNNDLVVYTDPVTADIVYDRVRKASVVQWLESSDRIVSLEMKRMHRPKLAPIARSSDTTWPPEIRNSWPWFIMGVSQTWLSLIRQVTAEQPLDDTSPDALLDYYRSVNDRVSALWRVHGQHAYLHHLNALFGYELLIIRETNLKRF